LGKEILKNHLKSEEILLGPRKSQKNKYEKKKINQPIYKFLTIFNNLIMVGGYQKIRKKVLACSIFFVFSWGLFIIYFFKKKQKKQNKKKSI